MLEFTEEKTSEKMVLAIKGELLMENADDFTERVKAMLDSNQLPLELDMEGVEFVDSRGIGELLGIIFDSRKNKRKVSITRPSKVLSHILSNYQVRFDEEADKN